jgi:hypothetical protein
MIVQQILFRVVYPLAGVALVAASYRFYGWGGVAVTAGALVMWLLLHFTRMMRVLKRAADRPVGRVDSAVMLNARLKPGLPLLQVVALTQSLGELLSARDEQPEVFRWSDADGAAVCCTFVNGKISQYALFRSVMPEPEDESTKDSDPAPQALAPAP